MTNNKRSYESLTEYTVGGAILLFVALIIWCAVSPNAAQWFGGSAPTILNVVLAWVIVAVLAVMVVACLVFAVIDTFGGNR